MKSEPTIIELELELSQYIKEYRHSERVLGYCKECPNYGLLASCPPFNYNIEERLSQWSKITLYGLKHQLEEGESAEQSYRELREWFDQWLLKLESKERGSGALFAGSSTKRGGEQNLQEERPSLEAYGFDLVQSSSQLLGVEILWPKEGEPLPYLMLIGAVCRK